MIVGWLPDGLVAVDVGLFTFVRFLDGMARPELCEACLSWFEGPVN